MEKTPEEVRKERERIEQKILDLIAKKNAALDRLQQEKNDLLTEFDSDRMAEAARLHTLQDECPHKNRSGSGKCPDCGK